jgi:hypothetical protein
MPGRRRWVEVQFHPFLSLAVPEGKWSIWCHGCFTPQWKPPWYLMHRRQHGLHSWSGNSLAPARNQTMISQSFSPQLRPGLLNLWHAALTSVPINFICFCLTTVSILWKICVYIQISDCVETEHELLVLANNTVRGMSLHKLALMWTVDCIFFTEVHAWCWLGEYVILDKTV